MMKYFLPIVILIATSGSSPAQSGADFPPMQIGQWRQHLPWQRARYVTNSTDKVYFATEWAVLELDKAERSPRFLTKIDGLSDVGMGPIQFNREANRLLLTYSNSNVDVWNPETGEVENLPFIINNLNLTGNKSIYSLNQSGTSAFLSCGFGLVKVDLLNAEVDFTTFTGVPVLAFVEYDGFWYMGTEDGLFRIPKDDFNPEDFSRWEMLDAAQGLPPGEPVRALADASGQLFLGAGKALYRLNDQNFEKIDENANLSVTYLSSEGEGLVIGWKKDFDGKVSYREPAGAMYDIHWTCEAGKPLYAVEDGNRKFWFADDSDEFRFFDAVQGNCDRFSFNSPFQHVSTEINIKNNTVYIGTPGFDNELNALYARTGVFIYENGLWKRFSINSNPELAQGDCDRDLWRVVPHPDKDKFFAGSFVGGLVEAEAGGATTRCYTQFNSILQNAGQSGANRTVIGGLAFDANDNLWISNYDAASPIAVLKPDGTLRNFSGAPANNLLQVAVDNNGYKWFVVGFNGGLLVYDSGDDIDSPADDRYKLFTTANSQLPTNTINCVAVDLDGDVWVGTRQGVVSFECGFSVFDPICTGSRRIVNVDGFNGFLLENQDIRTIAVDGANRKWFGTNNGIFVQSPSGENPEGRFTATNSPLFDNSITDIAINDKTGEAWIGTERGLISLRTEATTGGRLNSLNPYAYPNPVTPDYDGPIAIYGLAKDANVKITDVAGNLIYEGKALGGQAVWDGRDYLGRRAASGVYLIFATSTESLEDPDAVIAKVVILN